MPGRAQRQVILCQRRKVERKGEMERAEGGGEGRCGSTAKFRFTIMIRALTNIQGAPAQGRPTVPCFAATENSVGPFDSRVGPLSCRNVLTDTALLWSQTDPTASYSNKQTRGEKRIRKRDVIPVLALTAGLLNSGNLRVSLEDPKYLWQPTATHDYGNLVTNLIILFIFMLFCPN